MKWVEVGISDVEIFCDVNLITVVQRELHSNYSTVQLIIFIMERIGVCSDMSTSVTNNTQYSAQCIEDICVVVQLAVH